MAPASPSADYERAVAALGSATLDAVVALEAAQRRLDPPQLPAVRERIGPLGPALERALEVFSGIVPSPELAEFHAQLSGAAEHASAALALFVEPAPEAAAVPRILESFRRHCRAQESLYPLRLVLRAFGRYFAEPAWHSRLEALDPEPAEGVSVGLHRSGPEDGDGRGHFHLYVPERYDARSAWPLVVALHGGFGHGRDFLWTWLREARSRGALLLAPSSRRATWSLDPPDVDAGALLSMLDYVRNGWNVDPSRLLLTGLSDGATYTLLCGLREDSPFSALAPASGVLHPLNFANGNLERARGVRIYLVHGARDWMFPAGLARAARDALAKAGADVVYREIEDLSHAYAREENARILTWLDPERLALEGDA